MRNKINVSRTEIEKSGNTLFPEGYGILAFYKNGSPLYYLPSNRISKMWEVLNQKGEEEHLQQKKLSPLLDEYDSIMVYSATDAIDSLIIEKQLLIKQIPEYYQQIRLYDSYTYLGIDLKKPPFLSSKEDTADDLFYLGCFNDSFAVRELIDRFNIYRQTPACSGSDYPCYLYDEKNCLGYCIEKNHHKLKQAIFDNYLSIDEKHLANLRENIKADWDNLYFEKADQAEKELQFFEDYYRQLKFFGSFKIFSGVVRLNGKIYKIKEGLLESVTEGNISDTFSAINEYFSDYRPNELLAVPKNLYREMWTLYKAFSDVCSEKIDEIFESTSRTLKENFK